MSANPGHVVSRYNFSTLFSSAWLRAMTISNVIGGFKKTGVFPLDRGAIKLPKDSMEKLPGESGLSFIPLYTPSKSYKANFSTEEMRKNQLRFESGYDVPNERYEMWLAEFHPEVYSLPHTTYLYHHPAMKIPMIQFGFLVILMRTWKTKCRDDCQDRNSNDCHTVDRHLVPVFSIECAVNHHMILFDS